MNKSTLTLFLSNSNRILFIVWLGLAFSCVGLLAGLHTGWISTQDLNSGLRIGLFSAPFFLFGAVQLFLMYKKWFDPSNTDNFATARKVFWGIFSVAFVLVFIVFMGYFVIKR